MRRWMLHLGAVIALLWLLYVFMHIGQLSVWRRFRASHMFSFRYALVTPGSGGKGVNASSWKDPDQRAAGKRYISLADLPSVTYDPYPPGTNSCTISGLGPIKTPFSLSDLKGELLSRIQPVLGGLWRPPNCLARSRVAVIIPYRNRTQNLQLVTAHLNYFLQQQKQEYGVFVLEQADWKRFNRAKLLNIGFQFVTKRYPQFDCFVFHDADKLPLDTRHMYVCDRHKPRHMITRMRSSKSAKFHRGMLYSFFFGGVTALTRSQFRAVNGMSNVYWGWGREDDDLCARLRLRGLYPLYSHDVAGSYVNIAHQSDVIPNSNPWPHQHAVRKNMLTDGLNSLNFTIKSHLRRPFYTQLSVFL